MVAKAPPLPYVCKAAPRSESSHNDRIAETESKGDAREGIGSDAARQASLPGPPATPSPTTRFARAIAHELHIAEEAATVVAGDLLQAFDEGRGSFDIDKLHDRRSVQALAHDGVWTALAACVRARRCSQLLGDRRCRAGSDHGMGSVPGIRGRRGEEVIR